MLLGRPLRARLLTPALVQWLRERWLFEEHQLPAHPYRIALEESLHRPHDLPHPEGEPVTVHLPGFELAWWNNGGWWQTGAPAGGVAKSPPGGTAAEKAAGNGIGVPGKEVAAAATDKDAARGGITREPAGVAARFNPDGADIRAWGELQSHHFAALYLALNEALRASGLIPLHAAVVVRKGEATALVAPSGTGKTTTLLRLLAAGWTPLAEDLSWLDPDSLTVYGWDRGIRLWQETIDRFLPHLMDAPWTTDPDGKRFLAYENLGLPGTADAPIESAAPPEPRAFHARLTRIVRLERERAEISVETTSSTSPPALARHFRELPIPNPRGRPGLPPLPEPNQTDCSTPAELAPLPPHEAIRTLWETTGVPLLASTRAALAHRIPTLLTRVTCSTLSLRADEVPTLF